MKGYMRTELRDQEIQVDYTIAPAEPDVGIMGDYIDELILRDLEGVPLAWELDEAEEELLVERCFADAEAKGEPDDPYPGDMFEDEND